MADCGASGTALDHAARALLGGANGANSANGQAQKQLGNLFGHAGLAGVSSQNVLPVARPEHVVMPGGGSVGGDALVSMSNNHYPQQLLQHQQQQTSMAAAQHATFHGRHPQARIPHNQHRQPHFQMMQEQQQQMMMMQQQQYQHHQMMMLQQHQQMLHAQAMQQQAAKAKAQPKDASDYVTTTVDDYTDEGIVQGASIEELASAWADAGKQDTLSGDSANEGNVQGATIESLAAAWSEAQDQYYQSEEFTADPSDLYSGEESDQYTPTYKFTNDVADGNIEIPQGTKFLEEGIENFNAGNMASAIRNFELELQVNDPDNSTAWRYLGRCHAENDQDREAIVCFETAVERGPFNPESLLALGVSYVNELNHAKALEALKKWVTMNPKYGGAGMDLDVLGEDVYGDSHNHRSGNDSEFQELQNLLLKALEFDDSDAADVWETLGVAANVSRDFDTAIEAFQKAIDARPDDYQLWNKLGATLANSNQSAKALPAYQKALQLKPKYARAWLNLAISHSNLQDFDEAARCYLQTLSLNPAAVHCWSYLRVALSCSERWDLIPFAASQNIAAFSEHFDFVTPGS